ncbi:hypothetical protein [Marinicrinis sediminis]|uniref:DUF3137 domain-containing protein n=1 Tax=Marinicrinis sediminis TaxID=1652465 RepID=A0ABW5RAQ2_9BACL
MKKKVVKSLKSSVQYFANIKTHFRSSWGQLLILIFSVTLAFPSVQMFMTSHWYITSLLFITIIISWIQSMDQSVNHTVLKDEHEVLTEERDVLRRELQTTPERMIKALFEYFEFGYNERISIYRYEEAYFVPVGRYAKNKEFKKSGRKKYPCTEGFISNAWHNGEFNIENLPHPRKARQSYIKAVLNTCSIEVATLEKMKMKSRHFYCKNLDNINNDPIAVIVFESTNEKIPVDIEEIKEVLDSSIGQLLAGTIKANLPLGKE